MCSKAGMRLISRYNLLRSEERLLEDRIDSCIFVRIGQVRELRELSRNLNRLGKTIINRGYVDSIEELKRVSPGVLKPSNESSSKCGKESCAG